MIVVVPLAVSMALARAGSARAVLCWLGAAAYMLYDSVVFLFLTPFNRLFLLDVVMLGLAAWSAGTVLWQTDAAGLGRRFTETAPVPGGGRLRLGHRHRERGGLAAERGVAGDAAGPGFDLRPVAEVALGEQGAAGRQLPDRPLTQPEPARVQHAEGDAMPARMNGLGELGDFPGLGRDVQVPAPGVGGLGAQRAAAEQPHRVVGQDSAVAPDELCRLLLSAPHIHGAADHEGVIACQVACWLRVP